MMRQKSNREDRQSLRKRFTFEHLEDRRVLATIFWANELDANGNFNPLNGFQDLYADNASLARAIVHRAIDDWESVIESFNYADDGDPNTTYDKTDAFSLTLSAGIGSSPFGETTNPVGSDGLYSEPLGNPTSKTWKADRSVSVNGSQRRGIWLVFRSDATINWPH